MAAAAVVNPLDVTIFTVAGLNISPRAILSDHRNPNGVQLVEGRLNGLTIAALVGLPSPPNPFAPAVPSPPIAGNAALGNKQLLVADVQVKIMAMLAVWNPLWVPPFDPNAPAAGGGAGGAGGGGAAADPTLLAQALALAVAPKPERPQLSLGGATGDQHLAAFVGRPTRDPAAIAVDLDVAALIRMGRALPPRVATFGTPLALTNLDKVAPFMATFTEALGHVADRNPASFVTMSEEGKPLILGFQVGGSTVYKGARHPKEPLTAAHFQGFIARWGFNVRDTHLGVQSLQRATEREAALATWAVVEERLNLLATHLGGLLGEPTLVQGAMVTITGDLLNNGGLALLSGHPLDWGSVLDRYKLQAGLVDRATSRYAQLEAAAAVASAAASAQLAKAAGEAAQQAQQALARVTAERRPRPPREYQGSGGGGGGGQLNRNDRSDRNDHRGDSERNQRPKVAGAGPFIPDCAKNPTKVYEKAGDCPLHGSAHTYSACKSCSPDGEISNFKYKNWFQTTEHTYLPREGCSYVTEPRNARVDKAKLMRHG